MPKTVIFYATAGIGHKKAALAVKEAFREKGEKDVLLLDALDYSTPFFKLTYGPSYLLLVKYIPRLWGLFYYLLDMPFIYALARPLRRLSNLLNSAKLVKFMLEYRPDTVIATHFFAPEVVADLKKKGLVNVRLISVITDYRPHSFWLSKYIDYYVVAADYTKRDMLKRGIPSEKIKVFGIPCEKAFSSVYDKEAMKKKLDLDPAKKTIFVLGGGFGIGPIVNIVRYLDRVKKDFQCIVVCGYNPRLYNAMKKIARFGKHRIRVYSFIDNVHELMAASDLLISKSGGITVTEALNAGLPMIVVRPIPGQEMRNYGFLKEKGAALKIRSPKEVTNLVSDLIGSDKLKRLKARIEEIRPIDSAKKVADLAGGT